MDLVARRLPNCYGFSAAENIQVVCPSRKGGLGTGELNKSLQEVLNPEDGYKTQFTNGMYTFREGDKVMQIRNNYDIEWTKDAERGLGIFNGDIGIIKMIDRGSQTLMINFDGRIAAYSFDMANELELAYAVTVHKSQGSEFPVVIMPASWFPPALATRNLLYTAVTRGQRQVIIVGTERYVNSMVDNNQTGRRNTGLRDRLAGMYESI